MDCKENYMPDSPYKGLSPYSEADRLFFFGREKDRRTISDNLQASRLTILYGASGVGKSSVLRAGVAYHLRQAAKANVDKYGQPGWAAIVFPPMEGKLVDELSWQDPLTGIESQVREEVEQLVENLRLPEPGLSLTETLQAWTRLVQRRQGGGKLFIILDQFEEYFNLPSKTRIDDFAEEFCKAVNNPDLNVHFLVSIREDSLAKLDYFKGRILKFLNNRLEIKHLDWESACQAIEKPIAEYNRQQTILDNLCTSRLTVLYSDRSAHKSTVLREGIAHYLRQAAERNLEKYGQPKLAAILFDSWHDEKPLARMLMQVEAEIKNLTDIQPPQPGLSFAQTLQEWTKLIDEEGKGKLFIILDQFEQYFSKHPQEGREETFAVEFFQAVSNPDMNLHWLISIREDRLSELDCFREDISKYCDRYLHLFPDRVEFEPLKEKLEKADIVEPSEPATPQKRSEEKSIAIDPDLVEKILDDVKQTRLRGNSASVSSETQIETPYLQLVMDRLWKEEMKRIQGEDKEWQEGKRVAPPSRKLQKTTYADKDKLGGAKEIVKEHLYGKLNSLSESDREAAARIFNYLVAPSGAKIAQSVSDLVEYANENPTDNQSKLDCEPVRKLLDRLTTGESRILRRVGSSDQPYEQHYEIFHDVLGQAVQEWRREYRERKQKEDLEKRKKAVREISENLSASMDSLSPNEQNIAADCFPSLVHAYSVADLAEQIGCEPTQLADLLNKFAKDRFVRSVGPPPDKPEEQQYQIFDDFLAPVLLNWQKTHRERKKQQELLERARKQRTIAYFAVIGAIALAGSGVKIAYQEKADQMIAESLQAVQKFEAGQQLVGLQQAMRSEKLAETWVKNNPLSGIFLSQGKKQQLLSQSTFALQQILTRIREQNQFLASSAQLQYWNFSRDGQILAIGSADGTVQLWNLQTGSKLTSFKASGQSLGLGFSPDSRTLATISADGTVQQWDWQTRKKQTLFQTSGSIWTLNFSPSSPFLAIALDDSTVQLWNWQTGKKQPSFNASGSVFDLRFSPSRPILAIALEDGVVQLWNWETDTRQTAFKAPGAVASLRFSRDGKTLAAITMDGSVQLWNPQKGSKPFDKPGQVVSLSLNSNGQILATGSSDGTVQLWDWQTGQKQAQFKASGPVNDLYFGPNDQSLVTVLPNGTLSLWALPKGDGQTPFKSSGPVLDLSFSLHGQTLATLSVKGKVQLWDWKTGKLQTELRADRALSLSFSPDDQTLATGSADGTIQVWDWKTKNRPTTLKASSPVRSLDFSSDGKMLATFSVDRTVRVWDLQTPKKESKFEVSGTVLSLSFSSDGQTLATGSVDGTVQLWDLQTRKKESEFNVSGEVSSLSFSPDGQTLATGSADGTVQLWNWQANKMLNSFLIGSGEVSSLSFSPDGRILAIASKDGAILSDLNGNQLAQFKTAESVLSLRFSPDGKTLAALSSEGIVRMWPVEEDLGDLLVRGCQWLQPYLESHPDEGKDLPCQRK